MAAKKWIALLGGRIKRWKKARTTRREIVSPHWFRNSLNSKDRRKSQRAVALGMDQTYPFVHPHTASWYW